MTAQKKDAFRALGMERTGRFRTFLRLIVSPDVHPWSLDRRGWWRLPAAFGVSVMFLLLVLSSGCATPDHGRARRQRDVRVSGKLKPAGDAICSTVFDDMIAEVPDETRSPGAVFEIELPDAPAVAEVTLSSTDLPADAKLTAKIGRSKAKTTRTLGQSFEVDLRELGDRRTMIVEVESCAPSCKLRVEAQAAFGAEAALAVMLDGATKSLQKIDRGFAEQTSYVALDAREEVARARRNLIFKPCKAPFADEVAKRMESLVVAAADALEAMYGAAEPRAFDPEPLRDLSSGEFPAIAAHVRAMVQISELDDAKKRDALYWLSVARAERKESWIKLSESAPALISFEDASARIDLIRALVERPGSKIALPMAEVVVNVTDRSPLRGTQAGLCYGTGSVIPGGNNAQALRDLRSWIGVGGKDKLPISSVEDVVRVGVSYQRAARILCDLPLDLQPLEASLKEAYDREQLPGLHRMLVPIRLVRSSLAPDSALSSALASAIDRALCRAFEEKTIEKKIRSLDHYAAYIGDAVEIFGNASGEEITCAGKKLSASAARERLSRRYRALFGELKGTPHELATIVREAFGLKAPHVARPAEPDSVALDYPPAFQPSAKQMEAWQNGCSQVACYELAMLIDGLDGSPELETAMCTHVPEKVERPTRIEVGAPGLVTPLDLKCLSAEEFDLELRIQNGAGRALLVRSRQQFKIAGIQTTERHKQRDLKLGWVYTVVLDLEDRQMFGREKKITIKPSADEQAIYWSTTRTPEL